MTFLLPNIRKLFIPDKGMMLFDADLSGADAQVVAWEADDADLKKAFRAGVKIHDKNATDMWGDAYTKLPGDRKDKSTPKGKKYDECKRGIHATNYTAAPMTLTKTPEIGWPLHESETFQRRWFTLHPGIHNWHNRLRNDLHTSRTIYNRFGYRIIYFDRIDSLLAEAAAWGPQSTVALVTFKGALQLKRVIPQVEILLQVHDSLVFQLPFHLCDNVAKIREGLRIEVPYPDPLFIPWTISRSEKSWGDVEEIQG